jgi:hypothetical protein
MSEKDKGQYNPTSTIAFNKLLSRMTSSKKEENIAQKIAKEYAESRGIKLKDLDKVKVNPEVSKKIAQTFESLVDNPNDPAVKKAYDALIDETIEQYNAIKKTGLKVQPITPDMGNPYKTSKDLVEDVVKNNRMYYYPTDMGYGSGSVSNNPLLKATKEMADGKPMVANDVFRVVHDYFGHVKDANKFGATGEENAFRAHQQMFSPEAQKALATETRGQNSWVNYGPLGEANRANPAATTYAEQKAALMPDWALKDVEEIADPRKYKAKQYAKTLGKIALPAAAVGSALMSDSASDAIMDTLIPGGVSSVGQGSDEPLDKRQRRDVEASAELSAGEPMNRERYLAIQRMLNK